MSTPFSKIVGKPFFPSVHNELERRKTIFQHEFDGSNSEYFQPYFILKRKPKRLIKEWNKSDEPTYEQLEKKFSVLGTYSGEEYNYAQGLDHLEEKGGEFRADPHIISASIDVSDYTFFTYTINFKVPDIHDLGDFKNMWLDWGAPVEIEFGRKNNDANEIYQENDGNPYRQIHDGFIANFSFQEGGGNRSITGTMTLYSSSFLDLYDSAHATDEKHEQMKNYILNHCHMTYLYKNNELYNQNVESIRRKEVDYVTDNSQTFFEGDKSNYFYAVMDTKEYWIKVYENNENINKISKLQKEDREKIKEQIAKLDEELADLRQEDERSEVQLKSVDDIKFQIKRREWEKKDLEYYLDGKSPNRSIRTFWNNRTDRDIRRMVGRINNINLYSVPYQTDLINTTELKESISEKTLDLDQKLDRLKSELAELKRDNESVDKQLEEHDLIELEIEMKKNEISELENYLEDESIPRITKSKMNMRNIIGKKDLHKFALTNLNLESDDFGTIPWYYVSLRAIETFINEFQEDWIASLDSYQKVEGILLNDIKLSNVRIRDLDNLGLASKFPDKILINPWNKAYEINEQGEYEPNNNGTVKLLGDVFISYDHIDQLLAESKTPLSLVNNIIKSIKSATGRLIDLKKINESNYNEDNSFIQTDSITFYDPFIVEDDDNSQYHIFNLYNPKEKIKDVSVQTDLSDDMVNVAFHKGRGVIVEPKESSLMYRDEQGNIRRSYVKDTSPISEGRKTDEDIYWFNKTNNLIESKIQRVDSAMSEARNRIEHILSDNTPEVTYLTAGILAYLKVYFDVIIEGAQYDYLLGSGNNTIQIPLNLEFSLDGISSIIVGQVFKLNQSSFPMRMPYNTENILFIVNSVNHEFSGAKWTTSIGGRPHVSLKDKALYEREEVPESRRMKDLTLILEGVILSEVERLISES